MLLMTSSIWAVRGIDITSIWMVVRVICSSLTPARRSYPPRLLTVRTYLINLDWTLAADVFASGKALAREPFLRGLPRARNAALPSLKMATLCPTRSGTSSRTNDIERF